MKFNPFKKREQERRLVQRPLPKKRVCRKIIKRDSDGRIKEERYEGCSEQEIKMMREQGRSEVGE